MTRDEMIGAAIGMLIGMIVFALLYSSAGCSSVTPC